MTPRQRVEAALAHQQPDRTPIDLGSTAVTGMHVSVVAQVRDALGLNAGPVKVLDPYQMLGEIADDLKDALGIDTVGVTPRTNMFGFANTGWTPWQTPWGQDVLVPAGFVTSTAADGSLLMHPCGDRSAAPSAHLPTGGYFWDSIVRQQPIDEDHLNPEDNCEEFVPLSDADLTHFGREVDAAYATGRAVVATFGGTALGDIALVPAPFLKNPRGIRDITEWYVSTSGRQDLVHAIFRRQTDVALANLARLHAVVGNRVTAMFLCGTDFGTQRGPMCSTKSFNQLWAPYYREMTDWIHQNTTWKVFKHSCGGVRPFLDSFVDAGLDILNPVQCSATGMDAAELKAGWGNKMVFWGGGIDTQQVLPFGTTAQVREQVRERVRIFSPGGGFVFNTVHNIQARTPVANVLAMFDELRTKSCCCSG
ncbi:MAG: uroporphyrinogen decarboxylase family protein [Planctomycetota bacterium]